MQEQTQPPQSHFIWQPLLLVAVVVYLVAELYFLTAMVNTLDLGIRSSDFTFMEHLGRFISGAGIGLSVIIGLSMNCRMYQFPRGQRIAINTGIFVVCTLAGYFLVKSLYEFIEANASKPVVHCSVLGNAAIRVLDRGELPAFEAFAKTSSSSSTGKVDSFTRQLVRLYLPLHICVNNQYRRTLQASEAMREELAVMVQETGLPERQVKPALEIYSGFREQLPRFTAEISQLHSLNGYPEKMFEIRTGLIRKLDTQLSSQSRFTQSDVQRIVAIYSCALDTAIMRSDLPDFASGANEQLFMRAVTDCLYDRARTRFKTLPGVQKATDIYALEEAIALDWARQFMLSPLHIPEKALELMRQSFALVFLPTYAVFISTFVVFICIAAYFRTRLLIRAAKTNRRVNPVINAMLSPLVVVPGIWTLIFLWVPEPDIEKHLFPRHAQTDWVKVLKVTIRPLMHYYPYAHTGFERVNVPLLIAPKVNIAQENIRQSAKSNTDATIMGLTGYYVGEICRVQCEPVILDLNGGSTETAQLRYPNRECDNRLVYDSNSRGNFTFYESSKNTNDCPTTGVWKVHPQRAGLRVTVRDKEREMQAILKNLYI